MLPGVPARVLEALVHYLYLDTVRVRGNVRGELGVLGKRLGLDRLYDICTGQAGGGDPDPGLGSACTVSTDATTASVLTPGNTVVVGSSFRKDMRRLLDAALRADPCARSDVGGAIGASSLVRSPVYLEEASTVPWAALHGESASSLACVRVVPQSEDDAILPRDVSASASASQELAGGAGPGSVGTKVGFGHVCLLSRFEYFKAALLGDMALARRERGVGCEVGEGEGEGEGEGGVVGAVDLHGMSTEVATRVLRWIYDGDTDAAMGDTGESALETMIVARQLMLGPLCESVEETVVEAIDEDNREYLGEVAEMYGLQRLMQACRGGATVTAI